MKKFINFNLIIILLGLVFLALYITYHDGAASVVGLFMFSIIFIRRIVHNLKEAGEIIDRVNGEKP
jgi:hypothetical protein